MAAKSAAFDNQLLALIFNGTTIPGLADNTATLPLTSLYVALHTASPGTAGNQMTNEIAYGSYARQAIARNSGGFVVMGAVATFAANLTFPTATSGTQTATYFSIGELATGAGEVLYFGPITPPIVVNTNVTPQLTSGTQVTEA